MKEEKKKCPFSVFEDCFEEKCALWCDDFHECAIRSFLLSSVDKNCEIR